MTSQSNKVVQFTTVHPRYDSRILYKTSRSLANKGFDVTLLVADGKESEDVAGVNIKSIKLVQGGRLKKMLTRSFIMFKAALKEKADIYHFHDPELMPVGIMLKLFGKKVVYDVHEDVPRQILRKKWLPKPVRKPISIIAKILESITARIADAIVTVTPTIAGRFSDHQVIETRNYVSLAEFSDINSTSTEQKSKVTYIGGITEDRGIKQMIAGVQHTEQQITVAGKFQEAGLEDSCKAMQGWPQVDFLGWQERKDIARLLDETLIGLVLLQPTGDYEDAYPVKLFEYMAAGCAVIASDFPLWRGIVEEAQCGICVDPTDEKAIAEAITQLTNDREQTIKMGQNGRKAVLEKYNWESESDKLVTLYNKILGQ